MWYNLLIIAVLRSPAHGLLSRHMLLLSYTGRRSGTRYTLPVSYVPVPGGLLILSARDRTWWRNLRGGTTVTLRLQGRDVDGTSEVWDSDVDVIAGLKVMFTKRPRLSSFFGVTPGLTGPGDQERLAAAAAARVVVQVRHA